MTDEERQHIRAKLIDIGLWGSNDLGDPTTDRYATDKLHNRIEERLAPGFGVASTGYVGNSPHRKIKFVRGELIYQIATGDTHGEAICMAALLLPEFLRQHPDYAAQQ